MNSDGGRRYGKGTSIFINKELGKHKIKELKIYIAMDWL